MVRQLAPSVQWVARWEVNSLTDPTKTYVVAMKSDGSWACACPFWKFHKAPKAPCAHINKVRAMVDKTKTTAANEQAIRRQFQSNQPDPITKQSQPPYYVLKTRRAITFEE